MKFDCDKLKRRRKEKFRRHLSDACEWHRVFAIYQKLGPGDCRVLETIERRLTKMDVCRSTIRELCNADVYNRETAGYYKWEYRSVR